MFIFRRIDDSSSEKTDRRQDDRTKWQIQDTGYRGASRHAWYKMSTTVCTIIKFRLGSKDKKLKARLVSW